MWQSYCHMDTAAAGEPLPRRSLRDEQRETAQERIVSAFAELVNEASTTDVPLSAVAARAGVGERTLYRHFPTKNDLLDALFGWVTQGLRDREPPASVAELVDRTRDFFAGFARNPEVIRALSAHTTMLQAPRRSARRREMVEQAISSEDLPADPIEREQVIAIVHLMASSSAFLHFLDNYGMSADEATDAVAWAIKRLLGKDDPR
jgi:AcrR family transcriptional regulator